MIFFARSASMTAVSSSASGAELISTILTGVVWESPLWWALTVMLHMSVTRNRPMKALRNIEPPCGLRFR